MVRIRRGLIRNFSVNSSGIDIGGSNNPQVSFAPGATDWRIGGTSIYTDTLINISEFTNLFDQYKINGIYMQVDLPLGNSNAFAQPLYNPIIYYVADYDDSSDTDLGSLLQYPQLQQHNFWRDCYTPLIIRLSPKPLRDIAGSGIATGYGPMAKAPWIRTAEMGVPHYGLKMCLDWFGITQATSMKMKITLWYDLSFTNPSIS